MITVTFACYVQLFFVASAMCVFLFSVGSKGPSSQSYRGNMALLAWICSLRCSRFAPPFDVFNVRWSSRISLLCVLFSQLWAHLPYQGEPLLAVAVATGAVLNVRCRIHPFAFPVDHSFGTFCNWSRFKLSFRVTSYDVVPRLVSFLFYVAVVRPKQCDRTVRLDAFGYHYYNFCRLRL